MSFEEKIAHLNQAYFFREFTYSNTKFRYRAANDDIENEVELADGLLWLDNDLIVYQIKERDASTDTTEAKERIWFEKKVLGKATKQVRDTLGYLQSETSIPLENHRGHNFPLETASIGRVQKLVVFDSHEKLPEDCFSKKYYESATAGIIHLINAEDYLGIIKTLLTPLDFMDYLAHRESLITLWGDYLNTLTEQVLVGHYLSGGDKKPQLTDIKYLEQLNPEIEKWDISGIIRLYGDRIIQAGHPTEYYAIITLLAKLRRGDLKQFKQRYLLAIDKARANEPDYPYRMALPKLDCGFIFVPLTDDMVAHKGNVLQNYTLLHKYDLKLTKCLGMTFAKDGAEHFLVDWCLIDAPWEQDNELQKILTETKLFREVKVSRADHFSFSSETSD